MRRIRLVVAVAATMVAMLAFSVPAMADVDFDGDRHDKHGDRYERYEDRIDEYEDRVEDYYAEAILRTQLDFAQTMVGTFAKSAEAYQLMWGPFGGPAVGAMRTALEAQRRYLQELRKTVD